jgi:hypothetical protein
METLAINPDLAAIGRAIADSQAALTRPPVRPTADLQRFPSHQLPSLAEVKRARGTNAPWGISLFNFCVFTPCTGEERNGPHCQWFAGGKNNIDGDSIKRIPGPCDNFGQAGFPCWRGVC